MTKETKTFLAIIIGTIVVIAGLFVLNAKTPGKYDEFAQCITDSGATFYGASWCAHCQNQKLAFGKSEKLLPYKECSTPNGNNLELCTEDEITATPTWEFADGTRLQGTQTFETLAKMTGCTLPAGVKKSDTTDIQEGGFSNESITIEPVITSDTLEVTE